MRNIIYFLIATMTVGSGVLMFRSPDMLSMIISGVMMLILIAGVLVTLIPMQELTKALAGGTQTIYRAAALDSPRDAFLNTATPFNNKKLDKWFEQYAGVVRYQEEDGQILADVTEFFSEDVIDRSVYGNVTDRVPTVFTSLGFLGTIVGLMAGITTLSFSSVSAAITSAQVLLNGIGTAFYTSLNGLILAIAFDLIYSLIEEMNDRELETFIHEFHNYIIPTPERQIQIVEMQDAKTQIALLGRLPEKKDYNAFGAKAQDFQTMVNNEDVLMKQVLDGMENGEFGVVFQPRFDLFTEELTGAEIKAQWNHPTLGIVPAPRYIPLLEHNGYITQLDKFVWEKGCEIVSKMKFSVPITLFVTKTDMMAMDVPETIADLANRYKVPPALIEIKIDKVTYLNATHIIFDTESELRQRGFRVILGGFDGNFLSFPEIGRIKADTFQLNLSRCSNIPEICAKAKEMHIRLNATFISSAKEIATLRQCGVQEGLGDYFIHQVSPEQLIEFTK